MSVPESCANADMDPCCAETAPLCSLVTEFVSDWLKTRRSRKGQGYGKSVDFSYVEPFSPYAWLAFDTGLPEPEIRKVRYPRRYPLMELRVADSLVASIGEPVMFHDGTVKVVQNPLVGTAECCSGSDAITASVGTHVTPGMVIRSTSPARRVR